MLKFNLAGRLTAVLLLVSILFTSLPQSVWALPDLGEPMLPGESVEEPVDTRSTVTVVRRYAKAGSTVIGCMEDGTKLTVLGSSGNFYKIHCYDMKGYIAKSQVAQAEDGTYYVNCVAGSPETRKMNTYSAEEAVNLRNDIRTEARKYIGVRYKYGGTTPKGFDCSGYTQYVFKRLGIALNRSCKGQLVNGVIIAKDDLQCGDLIFFKNTTGSSFASHIGIYIGNGQLIHAGSRGITVVSLEQAYFTYHYMCARRVILSDFSADSTLPVAGITQNINSSFWNEDSQT